MSILRLLINFRKKIFLPKERKNFIFENIEQKIQNSPDSPPGRKIENLNLDLKEKVETAN